MILPIHPTIRRVLFIGYFKGVLHCLLVEKEVSEMILYDLFCFFHLIKNFSEAIGCQIHIDRM